MPNLKHLYYFYVYIQEGSITNAAKRLGITPPALCNQVKQLESTLHFPLTRRVSNKMVVTEHGEMVMGYAKKMFTAYEELRTYLSTEAGVKGVNFRVGIGETIGMRSSFDLLVLLEQQAMSASKHIHITLDAAPTLLESFLNGQLDLYFGESDCGKTEASGFVSRQLTFPVRFFGLGVSLFLGANLRKGLPFNGDPNEIMELANTRNLALVFPTQPSVLRAETDLFLTKLKTQPARTIECNSAESMIQLIERGIAVGFVPYPWLLDFKSPHEISVLGSKDGFWCHGLAVFTRNRPSASPSSKSHSELPQALLSEDAPSP